jgi:hypothetical protein
VADGTDRARLMCRLCELDFDVWGDVTCEHPLRFEPEDGIYALRCPSCMVLCDNVIEVNGQEVA